MKKFTLIAIILFMSITSWSQGFEWVRQIAGRFGQNASSIAVDSNGNVYTTGSFSRTCDFDFLGNGAILTSVDNSTDIFIQKTAADGSFLWVKRVGGTSGDAGTSIAVDGSGDVYISGIFRDTVDFNPDSVATNTLVSGLDGDIFVLKLTTDGEFL